MIERNSACAITLPSESLLSDVEVEGILSAIDFLVRVEAAERDPSCVLNSDGIMPIVPKPASEIGRTTFDASKSTSTLIAPKSAAVCASSRPLRPVLLTIALVYRISLICSPLHLLIALTHCNTTCSQRMDAQSPYPRTSKYSAYFGAYVYSPPVRIYPIVPFVTHPLAHPLVRLVWPTPVRAIRGILFSDH